MKDNQATSHCMKPTSVQKERAFWGFKVNPSGRQTFLGGGILIRMCAWMDLASLLWG